MEKKMLSYDEVMKILKNNITLLNTFGDAKTRIPHIMDLAKILCISDEELMEMING